MGRPSKADQLDAAIQAAHAAGASYAYTFGVIRAAAATLDPRRRDAAINVLNRYASEALEGETE